MVYIPPTPLDEVAVAEARATMQDKFPRLVSFFLEDAATYIGQIQKGFMASDAQQMVPPSHTLKSSARQMGAMQLSDAAKHIETEARKAVGSGSSVNHLALEVSGLKILLKQASDAYAAIL